MRVACLFLQPAEEEEDMSKDDYLMSKIREWLDTLYDKTINGGQVKNVAKVEWQSSWPQMFKTFPDPLLEYNRDKKKSYQTHPDAFRFKDSKVYFVDWTLFFESSCSKNSKGKTAVKCPGCRKADNVGLSGWAPYPRRVVGMETDDFVYSRRYKCKSPAGTDTNGKPVVCGEFACKRTATI
jgi:hypothetical protein